MSDPTDPSDSSEPALDHVPDGLDLDAGDRIESVEVVAHELPEAGAGRTSGFDGIGTRREARERALSLLYEAEQRGLDPLATVLTELAVPAEPFVRELVEGVSENQEALDAEIADRSTSWPLARMPALDRALLRLGTYELHHTDVPVGVCLSEAVELAKRYSTEDSHRFVNGVLAAVARDARRDEA